MNPQDPHPPRILPPHGHDEGLLCYQKAEVLYDLTFHFAHKHLAKGDRTVDPMIQAARSGKQNILGRRNPQSFDLYRDLAETRPGDVVANVAICLIHPTNFLLDRLLRSLDEAFVREGGLRERMTPGPPPSPHPTQPQAPR